MSDFDEGYIDINLDDVDDGREPLPDGLGPICRVLKAEKQHKEGSEYPYISVTLQPDTGDAKLDKRQLFLNLSFHPKALWNMKLFCKAVKGSTSRPNFKEWVDKKLRPTLGIVPSFKDPEQKVNEVKPPYHSVA
jgi:hypothetical protein